MADLETYTVTKLAGPKVAGQTVKPGQELQLTEVQARTELLAGAIRLGGKDEKPKDEKSEGSPKLADIQARARGLEKAEPEAGEEPETKAEPQLDPKKPAGKAESVAGKPATPPAGAPAN